MRHSILKKTSLYDIISGAKTSADNGSFNNNSLNNVSTTSTSKIVRFTGLDTAEANNSHSNEETNASSQQQPSHGSDNKPTIHNSNQTANNFKFTNASSNNNAEETFEEEANELKKYYRKSKALPFKQINLVGLNGEFLVSSSSNNASQIVPTSSQAALQMNSSFMRHHKSFQRSKSMRVASAQKHQFSDFRSNRQNTCPSITSKWDV